MNTPKKVVALSLIMQEHGNYLMQLRDFKEWINCPGQWGFFGGAIDSGESPDTAIIRELKEELNFIPRDVAYFDSFFYTPESALIHIFFCKADTSNDDLRLREGQELGMFTPTEILSGGLLSKKWNKKYPVTEFALEVFNAFCAKNGGR